MFEVIECPGLPGGQIMKQKISPGKNRGDSDVCILCNPSEYADFWCDVLILAEGFPATFFC